MSDYTNAPPYGASYPGQHQPNAAYPPPYPHHTYGQTDSGYQGPPQYAQNYDASMTSYGYNQHAAPAFGTAPVPSGVHAPSGYQAWNQTPTSLPTYATPPNGIGYPNYSGNSYSSAPQYPTEEQQGYPQSSQYNPREEGEASGGEYDDAYAPTNPGLVAYNTVQYHGSDSSGYMSTAQRASAYPRTQNHSPLQASQTSKPIFTTGILSHPIAFWHGPNLFLNR